MKMWEIVHPYVGEDSYVIDFVYLPDEDRVVDTFIIANSDDSVPTLL